MKMFVVIILLCTSPPLCYLHLANSSLGKAQQTAPDYGVVEI